MLTCSTNRLAIQRLAAQHDALFGLDTACRWVSLVDLAVVAADTTFQLLYRYFFQHSIERRGTRRSLANWLQALDQFLAMLPTINTATHSAVLGGCVGRLSAAIALPMWYSSLESLDIPPFVWRLRWILSSDSFLATFVDFPFTFSS